METKFKYIQSLDIEQLLEEGEGSTEYVTYMKNIIDQAQADEKKANEANKGKKMPKRRPKYLDEKIKAEEAKNGKQEA